LAANAPASRDHDLGGGIPRREAERMAREEVTARWRKEADMQQTKREGKR
jgi:hypothetical protein